MNKHRLILAGILICLTISFFTGDIGLFLMGLALGSLGGLQIEYTGVRILKLWSYSGGSFPVQAIVRSWGEIGAVAIITAQWIPDVGIALLVGSLFPLMVFELPNIRNGGQSYYAPRWLVLAGWAITIFSFQSTPKVVALLSGRGF